MNGSILEVGCGLGYVVDLIARNNQNIEINGCDISKKLYKLPKRNFRNIIFVNDITSDKNKIDKKFDIVIFNQILWYILEKLDHSFFKFS